MNSLVYQKIAEMVRNADHILLLTDERIDGDTTGSTLGLYHVLTNMGKQVEVFSPKPISETLLFLPGVDVISHDASLFEQPDIDLVIISDCSDGVYIKNFLPKMPRRVPLISFDHHATNPRYGSVNCVEPEAASTADVVWRFIKAAGFPMNKAAAHCLLTGITTDTQAFFSANTTAAAVEASAELTKLGGRVHDIVRHIFMNKSESSLKLWGLAFERLFFDEAFDAIATAITLDDIRKYEATMEDIEGISNFLNAMLDESHEVVVVYRETEDGAVKGSVRSRGRDVAKQAEEKYGGGGHKLAAGFKVKNAHLEEHDGIWVIVKNEEGAGAPNFVTSN
ncbi:MAG: DHH family phosphoesterase [Candidatus Uhrbacteria bacterium]|nr:DHH family phosphoesterase [Candidatus Uhrbacteria bacterium]